MVFKQAVERTVAIALMILVAAGCASTPQESGGAKVMSAPVASDGSSLEQDIARWAAAMERGAVNDAVAFFAADFNSPSMGSREEAVARLHAAADHGWFKDGHADLSRLEIRHSGNRATAGPVALHGNFGYADLELDLVERAGRWEIAVLHWNQF